jgi:hypothetical protein
MPRATLAEAFVALGGVFSWRAAYVIVSCQANKKILLHLSQFTAVLRIAL